MDGVTHAGMLSYRRGDGDIRMRRCYKMMLTPSLTPHGLRSYTLRKSKVSAATLRTYEQDTVTAMNTVGRYMMQTVIVLELVDWIVHI